MAGLGAFVAVAEAVGEAVDVRAGRVSEFAAGAPARRRPVATIEKAARRLGARGATSLAEVLAAVGSPHRLAMLCQLLEGPATYQSLRRRVRLQAGPLYHHINQLRSARLIGPKVRDTYSLTRAGRNVVLILLSLSPLLRDARPRPVPGAGNAAPGARRRRAG